MSRPRVDASPTEASDNIQRVEDHFNSMNLKEDPLAVGLPPSGVFPSGNRGANLMEDPAWSIHQDLLRLQQQQQFQQQVLMAQFKQRQDVMASQHMKQQQELLMLKREQLLEQQAAHQRQLELQQREQQEKQQIQQLLAKKDKPSANASSEVKDKLQRFLLNRKHGGQDMSGASLNHSQPRAFRHWTATSSLDHHSPPHATTQFQQPPFGQYDNFPLRKTASDSNLKVRSRLKEKVTERRSHGSPLLRRRDGQGSLKKKPWSGDFDSSLSSSAPGSGPSSPSSGGASSGENANGSHLPGAMPEDLSSSNYHMRLKSMYGTGSSNDNLYQSPSLPNISLGLPAASSQHSPPLAAAAKPSITGSIHRGAPLFPTAYLPTVPVSAIPHAMLAALPIQEMNTIAGIPPGPAQRLVRPLARTHSAPLPTSQQPGAANLHSPQQQHLLASPPHLMDAHAQQLLLLQRQRLLESEEPPEEEAAMGQKDRPSMKDARQIKQEPIDLTEDREERCRLRDRDEFVMKHTSLPPSVRLNDTGALASSALAHRTLTRAQSSPAPNTASDGSQQGKFTTGLAYDTMMLKHQCVCHNNANHPEHPGRLQSIWARLQETGLIARCERIRVRKATFEELQSCHSEGYVLFFGTSQPNRSRIDPKKLACMPKLNFTWLPCGGLGVDTDTIWNDLHSPSAVRMAAGAVIELAFKVAAGELKNGLAVVRPPGHHAETSQAMGFCFFNSIAIAAKQLRTKLKLNKILIVDWDVHHGNSTQKIFYEDQHVLYISLHRHDEGNFFPGTGAPDECGCGSGLGYNVNIAWHGGLEPPMGDAEYIAAFRTVVLPIAREFSPDVVLVSCGFDAAIGHPAPLGGYQVTPECFGYMTQQLLTLAGGRVVLVLEGGYDLQSICAASEVCTQVLLGEEVPRISAEALETPPNQNAVQCLQKAIKIQSEYWTSVRTTSALIACSEIDSQKQKVMETEAVDAMASLSVAASNPSLNEIAEPMEDIIVEDPKEG